MEIESTVNITLTGDEAESLKLVLGQVVTSSMVSDAAQLSEFDSVFAFDLIARLAGQIPVKERK